MHDRVHSLQELNELRKAIHTRIDNVLDSSQEFYNEEKEKKKEKEIKKEIKKEKDTKETIKVFNCFGDKPEIIEIEI